jgi:hypothetical protein
MKSLIPCCDYILRMCHRIGRPPISTIGFGRITVSSLSRVPSPPASMTAFIPILWCSRAKRFLGRKRFPLSVRHCPQVHTVHARVHHCVCLLCDPMIWQAQLLDQLWDCLECCVSECPAEIFNFSRSTNMVAAEGDILREIFAIRTSGYARGASALLSVILQPRTTQWAENE